MRPPVRDAGDVVGADEGSLEAVGGDGAGELDEGITCAQELLSSAMIEDNLAVLGGGDLESDAAGHVRLDEPRDHVDGGALGGEQQVDPGSSSELGDADDGLLHALAVGEHEVGELIDDHHDTREEALGARDALALHDGVPAIHDRAELLQLGSGLAHVGDDRTMEEVAQGAPAGELDLFGVDHDEAAVVGGVVVAEGADDRIDEDGLTGACGARDERMGHAGEVESEHSVELGDTQQRGELAVIAGGLVDELGEMHRGALVAGDLEGEVGLRARHHDDLTMKDRGEGLDRTGDFGELEGIFQVKVVAGELRGALSTDELGGAHAGERVGQIGTVKEGGDLLQLVPLEELIGWVVVAGMDVHGVPHLIMSRSWSSSLQRIRLLRSLAI